MLKKFRKRKFPVKKCEKFPKKSSIKLYESDLSECKSISIFLIPQALLLIIFIDAPRTEKI